MSIYHTIILGIVQGITEWLPISSDGHLVLFEKLLGLNIGVQFDVFLHLGSLLVILLFFRREIWEIVKLTFVFNWQTDHPRKKWGWYIILSSLITAAVGLTLYPVIEGFRTLPNVASWLMVTSLFLLAAKFSREKRELNWWIALVLGLAQGLAVMPGLSRSGSVIGLALVLGLFRKEAFDFAFIMAAPAIAGSFILTAKDLAFQPIYLVGLIVTMIVGYFSLFLLKKIVSNNLFPWFFLYTALLSLTIILAN